MGDLSKNFSRTEFECKCGCGFDTVDVELLQLLQHLRNVFHRKIKIISGCRCKIHNSSIQGAAKGSLHIIARAVDFVVEGVSPRTIYDYLNTRFPKQYGIGLYHDRIHLDTRKHRARWGM